MSSRLCACAHKRERRDSEVERFFGANRTARSLRLTNAEARRTQRSTEKFIDLH